MKFDFNDKYNTIAVYTLIIILASSVYVLLLFNLGAIANALSWLFNILKPLIYGFALAFILYPLYSFFERRVFAFVDTLSPRRRRPLRMPTRLQRIADAAKSRFSLKQTKKQKKNLKGILSLIATYLVVFALIGTCAALVIPQVARSYTDLSNRISGYIDTAQKWIDSVTANLPVINVFFKTTVTAAPDSSVIVNPDGSLPNVLFYTVREAENEPVFKFIHDNILSHSASYSLSESLKNFLLGSYRLLTNVAPTIISSAATIITEAKNILLGLIISVYYLAARKNIAKHTLSLMDIFLPDSLNARLQALASLIYHNFIQFINGKLIDALIIGVLCFILMSVFGMPYAPLISVLVGVTNVIPYLGPFLGAAPGAFIIFVSNPRMVIWFILLIIAIQQLDSIIIEPYVLHERTSLPPVWIVISVVVMGGLFGIVGMFLGVPIFAVLHTLIKDKAESRLAAKGLPVETDDWIGYSP